MPLPSVSKAFSAVFLASSVFRAVTVLGADSIQPPTIPITVHEWGTFTSVAGNQGESVSWAPLAATSDLPCFVHRLGKGIVKFTPGLVRMETPVVYFSAGSHYGFDPSGLPARLDHRVVSESDARFPGQSRTLWHKRQGWSDV